MEKSELKQKLEKTLEFLKGELSQIHTGRVTPSLLDIVEVNAYGTLMSVKEVATIAVIDAHTLQVSPWDKGLVEPLAKAIRESELNLNPAIRGTDVLVPVPELTEERRKEFTRLVTAKVEEAKNSFRNIRQEAMKDLEASFSNKEFGEDEKFKIKEEIETTVKDYVKLAEDHGEDKKKSIMNL